MNKKLLYAFWGCLFILCAGFGFIPEPEGTLQILMSVLSLLFFLPPAYLLFQAGKKQDRDVEKLIRNLSGLSLGLTLIFLVLNFFAAFSSEALGLILHYVLTIVSSPMICSGHWAMSLFLWACLLITSLKQLRR